MLTRRAFLNTNAAAALATRLFAAPADSKTPNTELEALGAVALAEAKKQKASYCDIRIIRYRRQVLNVRLNPDRGSGKTLEVPGISDGGSFGFGVRVIANGTWGFAASPIVTKDEIARVTREAVVVARANSVLQAKPVQLAPVKAFRDRWQTPHERDPFAVSIEEKLELIRAAAAEAKKERQVFSSGCNLSFRSEDKYFASSEGSSIQQLNLQTFAEVNATAVDLSKALSKTRSYTPQPVTAGYEYVPVMNLVENARRVREEVIEHLKAPPVTAGKKDLVLLPSHLWLTIHESIGHSTELDRALGYEANYAGTSFLTTDKMGKQRIGSEIVNVWGDRTSERGLATIGYDDDGVKATKWPIIERGVFKHYQTIRDQAHLVGEKESRGCCYADNWASVPFQRMPNVWLEPGKPDTTLDDLIAGVEDGILIDGNGSFSIDQQRYNFQFGGDAFWEIKGGKKRGMVSRVAYQSRTTDFWTACDGIAGPSYWQQWGAPNDGKGEPAQVNSVSHGCSPARFRKINVMVTD
ncbi:MAG: TldD/PmbA family protein [Acidobacteria bacterium]|nr:TldD/PmbA family protein [Acidobacteriota bacterium]